MPKKTFNIAAFQDMYFDTRRNNSDWKLEPRSQPNRTLSPVMRTTQLDDITTKSKSRSVDVVNKKQYGFLPNTDVLKYTVDNSGASGLGGSGQGSGMRETSTMPRVRVIPVRKPQNPNKEHNVEWLDKLSIRKSFILTAANEDGLWAVYQGRVYTTQKPIPHTAWFGDVGLPFEGAAFDRVTRGYFTIDNNILRLVAYAPYGDMDEFDDYQNRILDRIGFADLYEEIKIVRDAYPRVSIKLNGSESSMLVPYRDYNDSFFKRVTPGEGHRPYMRHKTPGEELSKIPIRDLPTKPFFMNSPKFKKKLRQPPTPPKKKSFSLSSDKYDKAYASLYKKYVGQLIADHKDEILSDAAEMWGYKGFTNEKIISEWGALSTVLDKAPKEQFIEILKSYKRQLGDAKTSNSNGLDPAPSYGGTNTYPYKGTGPAMCPSSQLEVMLNPIQMRETQVNNRQLTRILGTDKEAIDYTEESLKKSLDELDADTALQWIGQAGGKMKLLDLLKKLTINFGVTIPQKATSAIDEGYHRWKEVPTSRALGGVRKSFKIVAHENAAIQTSSVSPELVKFIREFQSTIDPTILSTKEDEEGWIDGGLQEFLHATVLYGIKDKDVSTVKEIFQSFSKPIEIEAKDLIHFDNEDEGYSVAVVECASEGLVELHNLLSEAIPNKHEYDFAPHITIAYLHLGERVTLPEDGFGPTPIKWDIATIEVSQTDDSITKIEKKSFKISNSIYTKKSFLISSMTYDEYIESGKGYRVSESDAKRIADDLDVDLNKVSFEQFRIGISIEMEHGSTNPRTNVIDDDTDLSNDLATAAKIALTHLNEVSDYYDKLIKHVEAKKSFKVMADIKQPVSDDVYDAFTEKGYAFKNYQLSADQINEAIDHGKDLSLLLKYQELTDKQKVLTINKAIDKKIALVYIYEEEKSHLNENQLTALLTALYDKAEQDGTNLQYVLKNFDLEPEKKNKIIMKGLTDGVGLHYLFKSGLLNIEQREFAVTKAIETGFGLLDLLKFERLNEDQKNKIINKAIERGVALIYILRKENVTEEQKKQIFEKAMAEGKGYYYLLKRFKLKPEQLKMAINKSKHSIDNLEYILKFQDLGHDQKVYIEKKLDVLKERKRETREKALEKKRESSKEELLVVPGSRRFRELQAFFRYSDKGAVTEMHKLLKTKNFDGAEELLGEWDIDEIL